jgi:deazaflavin-dependent oxidoreductase (nitroreductase family)
MLFGEKHVRTYEESAGEEGYDWNGAPILILTTRGRRSGEERKNALIFQEHDGDYLIVASRGGSDQPPAWYLNLSADPDVTVQVKADRFKATARTASPDEKRALWSKMTAVWPDYDTYQTKTSRDIPIVVLERA